MITETAQRFLRAVAGVVPADRVVEVHLFAPRRQGHAETGVAVIAVAPEGVAAAEAAGDRAFEATMAELAELDADVAARPADEEAAVGDEAAFDDEALEDEAALEAEAEGARASDMDDDLPLAHEVYADAEAPDAEDDDADEAVELGDAVGAAGETVAATPQPAVPARAPRHAVYTARYRLLITGPARGRWEFDCKPEADAPLVTVETVVRGVKDRAGDEGDPERLDGDGWRAAIAAGAWATPA
jgi:hypothetical protein